jgi:hypothetical protein
MPSVFALLSGPLPERQPPSSLRKHFLLRENSSKKGQRGCNLLDEGIETKRWRRVTPRVSSGHVSDIRTRAVNSDVVVMYYRENGVFLA